MGGKEERERGRKEVGNGRDPPLFANSWIRPWSPSRAMLTLRAASDADLRYYGARHQLKPHDHGHGALCRTVCLFTPGMQTRPFFDTEARPFRFSSRPIRFLRCHVFEVQTAVNYAAFRSFICKQQFISGNAFTVTFRSIVFRSRQQWRWLHSALLQMAGHGGHRE